MKTLIVVCIAFLASSCGNKGATDQARLPGVAEEVKKCDSICDIKVQQALKKEKDEWSQRMSELRKMIMEYPSKEKPKNPPHITGQAHVHNVQELEDDGATGSRKELKTGIISLDNEDHGIVEFVPFIAQDAKWLKDHAHVSFDFAKVLIPDKKGESLRFVIVAVNLKPEGNPQYEHK